MIQEYTKYMYDEVTKKYFTHNFDKFQLISFAAGFGGGILYRILAHNEKYYWDDSFSMIESNQTNKGPLDWPDHDIGYKAHPNMRDKEGRFIPKNPLEQRLTVVHVGCFEFPCMYVKKYTTQSIMPGDDIQEFGLKFILRTFEDHFKKAKGKIVLIRTHDFFTQKKFPKTTTIRIWGNNESMPNTQYKSRKKINPIKATNVVNVNIDNLLSLNYNIFEDEYFSLCENLSITPTPIPVRGYILNYLDRRNNYSNKVIPLIK